MFDINTSKDRLETILQFFNLSTQLLINKEAKEVLKDVCGPMLELVYRTYTDDQYQRGSQVKDLSIEIVELLQNSVDKPFFIEKFGEIKGTILQKRSARKMKSK